MKRMDIIDLLMNDHDDLRIELNLIRKHLSSRDLRDKIRAFISSFELHDSVEEEVLFFPIRSTDLERFIWDNEKTHQEIWMRLDCIVDCLNQECFRDLQRDFFDLASVVNEHMEFEERTFFPLVRELLGKEALEDLGKMVEEKYITAHGELVEL